jgi:hypothetical protein
MGAKTPPAATATVLLIRSNAEAPLGRASWLSCCNTLQLTDSQNGLCYIKRQSNY